VDPDIFQTSSKMVVCVCVCVVFFTAINYYRRFGLPKTNLCG